MKKEAAGDEFLSPGEEQERIWGFMSLNISEEVDHKGSLESDFEE